ncbi:MAG: pantoate--beta-alanine ligase [bacterium]
METVLSVADMRALVGQWRSTGHQVAFVPTMGALHQGHISLVNIAKKENMKVVVSIFVNPLQFGPNEDFSRYPRTLKDDIEKLQGAGAEAVFAPAAAEIYPDGFQTVVSNEKMAAGLCGRFRPGHFSGVLTVVAKLFNIVQADATFFGKKDYQQWRLIERMALDLQMPSKVIGCETVRESDGLAMSSRNRYMSTEERSQASLIYEGLTAAKQAWQSGERSSEKVMQKFSGVIAKCEKMRIQYAEIVDKFSLEPAGAKLADTNLVMIIAVLFGDVRLIDNLEF